MVLRAPTRTTVEWTQFAASSGRLRSGRCAGPRSAIFQRQRHHVPLALGRKKLDVDVDDLVHLGTRIVPPLRRQRRACLASRNLLTLPVVQETTVDAHPCNVGTNHARA